MIPIKNASSDMNSAERPMKQTTRLSALAMGLRLITTAAPKTSITKAKSQKRMGDIYRFRILNFGLAALDVSLKSARGDDVFRHRIEDWATPDRFAKRFAEMAQARVAYFRRGFRDVMFSSAQKLGGTFHPELAQKLRDGEADFFRKNPAQIKRAAPDFTPEHLERGRLGEIAREQFLRARDPVAGDPLLPHAKELGIFRREKKMRH